MEALRTRQGSADLCFQSIAGSEAALSAFGINTGMLSEAEMLFREEGPAKGPNVMYFGDDRAGFGTVVLGGGSAAISKWNEMLRGRIYCNTVVGFMGRSISYDNRRSLTRAALGGRILRASARTADGAATYVIRTTCRPIRTTRDDPDTSGNGGRSLCDGTAAGG